MQGFEHARWMFDQADDALLMRDPRWHRRRSIAAALRELDLLLLTTDADQAVLEDMELRLTAAIARLRPLTPLAGRMAHQRQMDLDGPANRLALEMSPVIGRSSGASMPMTLRLADGRLSASVDPRWTHEGPPGWMHGGLIAALFDEFLGLAQGELGPGPGKTGTLTVRYLSPTPLDATLRFEVESAHQAGRKRTLVGTLTAGDICTARAEAIFIVPR